MDFHDTGKYGNSAIWKPIAANVEKKNGNRVLKSQKVSHIFNFYVVISLKLGDAKMQISHELISTYGNVSPASLLSLPWLPFFAVISRPCVS